jgi:hypothetical protein
MQAEAANSTSDRAQVIAALRQASAATGSDFHYLLGTAMRESSLKTQAQSSTSSACGLFQFTGQTWLGMVKTTGARHGLGAYADQISQDGDGHFRVADPAQRQAILALRNDPAASALMAGEFANKTKATLEGTLGRNVCEGELYAAHFLGPQAACKLIQMNGTRPDAKAADVFPQAAGANRSVFYHSDGSAKSVHEVYNWALKQPNGSEVLSASPAMRPPFKQSAPANYAEADNNALLSSVLNWAPHISDFSALSDGGDDETPSMPSQPFLLTPGVMDVLSSVGSFAPSHR